MYPNQNASCVVPALYITALAMFLSRICDYGLAQIHRSGGHVPILGIGVT
jgi:hypothetical protein